MSLSLFIVWSVMFAIALIGNVLLKNWWSTVAVCVVYIIGLIFFSILT